MTATAPTLTTERLLLRPWRDSDLAPFAALNADPEVMEHFPATLTTAESNALAERIRAAMAARGFGWFAAEASGVATFIGFIGLSVPDFGAHFLPPGHRVVEVGWRLARPFWGRGYATGIIYLTEQGSFPTFMGKETSRDQHFQSHLPRRGQGPRIP